VAVGPQLPPLPDLAAHLKQLTRQIPPGSVTTYGDLADALGDRRASRWVGTQLLQHPHDDACRCHRVVQADGQLGKYVTGSESDKRAALCREGVPSHQGRVDLARFRFALFQGPRPLDRLRNKQLEVRSQISLLNPPRCDRVAGVDVSYRDSIGVAAYVELDPVTRQITYRRLLRQPVTFPYIPTYLAFRELPIVLELLEFVRREHALADVVMVDGSGMLHPLRAGVATMIGVLGQVPTIGITKKHLFGRVDASDLPCRTARDVIDPQDGTVLGAVMRPTESSRKPLYISPGQQISVPLATDVTLRWLTARRLPDPVYWADRLSRTTDP
jgi:deoxyribonuclease V